MLPWMKPGSKQPDDTATVASSATAAWPAEVAADPSSIVAAPSAQLRADALTRWLAGDPPRPEVEQLLHALQDRDRGAARVLRERLAAASSHEQAQLALAALTARAQELVAKPTLTSQDAVEIDALLQPYAPAQWPEALTAARQAITERLHAQTELQALVRAAQAALADWRAAVRAAGSAPLAQAQAEHVALAERQQQLQAQVEQIAAQAEWPAMPPRLRAQWQAAAAEAFAAWQLQQADLARAVAALADSAAELPQHRGWAAEVRAHRAPAPAPVAEAAPDASGPPAARADNGNHVAEAKLTIDFLERALAEGHLKAAQRHADKLRALLSVAERSFPAALTGRVQAAVAQTQQLAEWQRWRTDQLREELCVKAEALRDQPLAPRAQADALRQLRDEWKALDQTGAANGVLWQRFDAACTTAHAPVEAHVAKEREQMAQAEAARRALIDELRAWHAAQAGADPATTDWRAVAHALDGFADRWRHGGHLPEKRFTKLQADWRAAFEAAAAPHRAAQAAARQRRDALIARAEEICASSAPNVSELLRALLGEWQAEAKAFALPRPIEQKLWDRFRKPQDAWHEARRQAFEAHKQQRGAQEQGLRDALTALDAAQDEPALRAAWQAMEQHWDAAFPQRRGGPRDAPVRVPHDLIAWRRRSEEQARKRLNALHEGRRGHALDALLAAWAARDAALLPPADTWSKPINKAVVQQWATALQRPPEGDAAASVLRLEVASETDSPVAEQAARRALQLSLLASRGRDELIAHWPDDVTRALAAAHSEPVAARLKRCLLRLVR